MIRSSSFLLFFTMLILMLAACSFTLPQPTITPTLTTLPTETSTPAPTKTVTTIPSETSISLIDITAQQVRMFLNSIWLYTDESVKNLEIIHGVNGLGTILAQGSVNIFQGLLLGGMETPDSLILVLGEQNLEGARFVTPVRVLKSLVLEGGHPGRPDAVTRFFNGG